MPFVLAGCRVVLVRPKFAANIGSVARILRNFGVQDCVLVDPAASPLDLEAVRLATHGAPLLEKMRTCRELSQAVADCALVIGTTSRIVGVQRESTLSEWDTTLTKAAQTLGNAQVALVFGSETNGLENSEMTLCDSLITIDSEEECPSLNLAQAVAVTVHSLRERLAKIARAGDPVPASPLATFAERERMFADLKGALEGLGYLFPPRGDALFHGLSHTIARADLSPTEVRMLWGLARQIEWYVETYGPNSPAGSNGSNHPAERSAPPEGLPSETSSSQASTPEKPQANNPTNQESD